MSTNILFQHPKNSGATSAEVVVTPNKIRCKDRVYDVASVQAVDVKLFGLRYGRLIAILFFLVALGIVPLFNGDIGLGLFFFVLMGFLLYRTIVKKKYATWIAHVIMQESEDVVMSGDVSNRIGSLYDVDHRTATEFVNAVERAVKMNGGVPA